MTIVEGNEFSLQHRYEAASGEILATGVQALVRLPIDVMRDDRRAGRKTATFISGYQGSPLGGYDKELASQRKLLDEYSMVHVPGVNEELAATSVMGSQQSMLFPSKQYDGVLGIWYGKSPGLDRAGDAIRHGNFGGTSRLGGVLLLVGDDPACKSSTLPSRSDPTLVALHSPVFYPGTIQEVLDLGRHAIAMSRLSGLWVSFKIVTSLADGSGTAFVSPDGFQPVLPTLEIDGKPFVPTLSSNLVTPHTGGLEAELLGPRIELARRYVEENRLDRFVTNSETAWLGIVAGGHDAQVVLEALSILGVSESRLAELGVRLLKLASLHPLNESALRELARGTSTLMVVEDKIDFLETRLRSVLYGMANAPAIVGKRDHDGKPLVNLTGALTVENLVDALRRVLTLRVPADQLATPIAKQPFKLTLGAESTRTPFFCSGCPHNTGLQVPEGSLVGAGIGCHGMVSIVPREKTGKIMGLTQMGGEGSQWIGIEPFVADKHFIQNVGDGTYFHSGQLSIQAAVSAGSSITFKLLYNAAVGMTGGQDAAGVRPPHDVARVMLAQGVKQVVITTDDPGKYDGISLPSGATVLHRDKIVDAQEELRKVSGVTVLIHDQQCAAEKRRDRKRGVVPQASFRVVIDERVCEGCGDCGVQSNCLSLHPHETEFGRKTRIDQASCNVDASCLRGDCPAFITVQPGKGAKSSRVTADVKDVPAPKWLREDMTLRMPGIGGTGVVTVSQMLAVAAKMHGKHASSVDQTGLSQKAGPVVSTITIGDAVPGRIDALIGFDALASATAANLAGLDPSVSVAVVSTSVTPTGRMVGKLDSMEVDLDPIRAEVDSRTQTSMNRWVDASTLTTAFLGNALTANVFLLGVAAQAGLIPIPVDLIEKAIEVNGAAVEANLTSFRWGRRWYHDPEGVERAAHAATSYAVADFSVSGFQDVGLQKLVERRAGDLVDYQSRSYADRYVATVRAAHEAERAAGGTGEFATTVARELHHLMAYKDEYEVARLLLAGRSRVVEQFGAGTKLTWNLHPPTLRAMGMGRKLKLGSWSTPALMALRSMKNLRGTAADPFGRAKVRKVERSLITEYEQLVKATLPTLVTDPARAARIVGLIDQVRGFEDVKLRNVERYRAALKTREPVRLCPLDAGTTSHVARGGVIG